MLYTVEKSGSSWNRVGNFESFYRGGSMQVSILSRRYSSAHDNFKTGSYH